VPKNQVLGTVLSVHNNGLIVLIENLPNQFDAVAQVHLHSGVAGYGLLYEFVCGQHIVPVQIGRVTEATLLNRG
jgi:hypothetical protein